MAEAKKTTKAEEPAVEVVEAAEAVETTPEVVEAKAEPKKATAKAGKRSEKAIKEVEEKEAKEERKAAAKTEEEKPKAPAPKTRSVLERKGKNFREAAKLVEADKEYSLSEALSLATKTSPAKFDATVEMHIRLNVDPRHADQNIRGNLVLPAGTGKSVRVAVFAQGDNATKAKEAGADIVGFEDLAEKIKGGAMDFDVVIATPDAMRIVGQLGQVLGPRGLMPNPKVGTVTTNVEAAVKDAKSGQVRYRTDKNGIIHCTVGKVDFAAEDVIENIIALISDLKKAKPASSKGQYLKKISLSTTMGPGLAIDISSLPV